MAIKIKLTGGGGGVTLTDRRVQGCLAGTISIRIGGGGGGGGESAQLAKEARLAGRQAGRKVSPASEGIARKVGENYIRLDGRATFERGDCVRSMSLLVMHVRYG